MTLGQYINILQRVLDKVEQIAPGTDPQVCYVMKSPLITIEQAALGNTVVSVKLVDPESLQLELFRQRQAGLMGNQYANQYNPLYKEG